MNEIDGHRGGGKFWCSKRKFLSSISVLGVATLSGCGMFRMFRESEPSIEVLVRLQPKYPESIDSKDREKIAVTVTLSVDGHTVQDTHTGNFDPSSAGVVVRFDESEVGTKLPQFTEPKICTTDPSKLPCTAEGYTIDVSLDSKNMKVKNIEIEYRRIQ